MRCVVTWKKLSEHRGSGTLHLRTLHLWMLHLRKLELWKFLKLLDITPSGSYTFGQFHLWNITPLEVTPSYVSPSEHYTFGTLQLRKITPSTVSEDV